MTAPTPADLAKRPAPPQRPSGIGHERRREQREPRPMLTVEQQARAMAVKYAVELEAARLSVVKHPFDSCTDVLATAARLEAFILGGAQ
jgi:hypothetical protein